MTQGDTETWHEDAGREQACRQCGRPTRSALNGRWLCASHLRPMRDRQASMRDLARRLEKKGAA